MAKTRMTPVGYLYFPALFTPKVNKENPAQGPRFSCVVLFDDLATQSTAYQALRASVMEVIAEKWGAAKASDAAFVRSLRLPFRAASEKSYAGFEDGAVFISAWKKAADGAPGVVDLHGQQIVVPGDVFSGQLARLTVRPFAYDSNGNKGVSFGLEHVQIVKADMARRDGQQSAEQAFGSAAVDPAQAAALGIGASAPATASPSADTFPF